MNRRIEWTADEVGRFWAYQATRKSSEDNYFSASRGRWIIGQTASLMKVRPGQRILDIGCGKGHFLEHLAKSAATAQARLNGCDFSEESVTASISRMQPYRSVESILVSNGLQVPFEDASIDFVFSIEVVEHLHDQFLEGYLQECARVLKKGGLLIITTPNSEDLEKLETFCPNCSSIFHIWQHVRNFTNATLSATTARFGFETVRCQPTFFGGPLTRAALAAANGVGLSKRGQPHLLGVFRKS